MRLTTLLESRFRTELLEFQQELIDRLPDCFEFELDDNYVAAPSCGIRIECDNELIGLLSFGSLRPFNVTCELISRTPNSSVNGWSAWTDHEGFFKHLIRALGRSR